MDRAACLFLQALQLARQQRNDWALVESVQCAVMWAGQAAKTAPDSIRRSTIEAAAAAAAASEEVEQAMGRCRRLLPRPWVDELVQANLIDFQQVLQAHLTGQPLQPIVVPAAAVVQQQLDDMGRFSDCSGCGRHAVGLRLCSRCKKAQYCSTGCQRTHWRVHKRECQPA